MTLTKERNQETSVFSGLVTTEKTENIGKIHEIKLNPFLIAKNFNLGLRKPIHWKIKRIFDFTSSIIGIILISPVLLFIAMAIKLESKGNVLFKQKRVGLYGKNFYIYKFRSMEQNAEKKFDSLKDFNDSNSVMFKMFNDPRITKVGKIIRKYSLDELPQLFNVIKGEMSLVGPRPPIQAEVDNYEKWHYLKFSTLPGLTGMWQVSGRSKIKDFNRVIGLDYRYISNWDLKLDLCLLLRTISVVIKGKGAA
ncbi:MAG: sugar transferase [bacterium]